MSRKNGRMNRAKRSTLNKYFSLLFKVAGAMLFSIFLFFSLGFYFDRRFGMNGILIIVGTFIGVFVGFYFIFKIINSVLK